MPDPLTSAPVLSTPDDHILTEAVPTARQPVEQLTDDQLQTRYEISRTIQEIKNQKWKRVALQFPDHMLCHSGRVFQLLARGLGPAACRMNTEREDAVDNSDMASLSLTDNSPIRLTILGDTSYGSCCVDEVAAEHVDADAVLHYGRACLSPTTRLPVHYIYTAMDLDQDAVIKSFRDAFPEHDAKVILTADVPFADHVATVTAKLKDLGYSSVFAADIVHDPSSSIPNRTIPPSVSTDPSSLSSWSLFHISDPPTSLLLTLTSRMSAIRIFPTSTTFDPSALETSTRLLLRRRYALITSLTTTPVWGVLINTLSVSNYLSILTHVQRLLADAGKKSYLFVVGKINPAKIANFSEIGGWVVIGCWESSLIDSREFFRPIITPFELELVLQSDEERVWTGEWRGDFQNVLEKAEERDFAENAKANGNAPSGECAPENDPSHELATSSDSEDEPPEFDLRTGRYVSRPRPARSIRPSSAVSSTAASSTALARRANGDIVSVNGVASPAAEYLKEKRTWRGLGSDFEIKYEEESQGSIIEEGRTGVARGYTVGESART